MQQHAVLIGKPGSGKGTLAKQILANDTDFVHLSTGDVFRHHMATRTDLGIEIEDVMNSGCLVNDELTIAVVEDFIVNSNNKRIIFDGFPRNESQAIWLVNYCLEENLEMPKVIFIDCDTDICVERIFERASIQNRQEDNDLDTILKRMLIYENETESVVDFFEETLDEDFITIDGSCSAKDIFKKVHSVLIQPS